MIARKHENLGRKVGRQAKNINEIRNRLEFVNNGVDKSEERAALINDNKY